MTQGIILDQVPHAARTVLRLRGPDTERFLQGLLSADLSDLPADGSVPATLLTPKGQLVSEVIAITAGDDTVDLVVPADVADGVFDSLDRHIIMDDVTVERRSDAVALVWPPLAAGETDGVRVFDCRHPAPGSLVLGAPDAVAAVLAGVDSAGPDDFLRHRIETASPGWGHELTPGRLPPELGFAHAVSYEKGCFMGQEPLARVHARGQVNRVMVSVRAPTAPSARADLTSDAREKAGEWTTWADALTGGGVVGLALVHRSLAEPGTQLRTREDNLALEVASGPLGDDPGAGRGDAGKAARAQLGRR